MAKLFKILGSLIAVLVLLVVAALVVLPMVIDPNDYKAEIVAKVSEQTGREFRIDGELKLSVFPWLGIEIGDVALGNAKGFGEQPFAAVKRAALRVKLMPLLSKQLEVDTIGLDGLQLNLARAKDGRSNWDDLAKGGQAADGDPQRSDGGGGPAGLSIGGVRINDARVVWDDRSSGQHFQIERFNLNSYAIAPGRPVGLELEMSLRSKEPALSADVRIEGTVSLDEARQQLDVSGLGVVVEADGEALPGGALRAELASELQMALGGKRLALKGLKLGVGDLQLSGEINASDLDTAPAFTGTLALAELNLRQWLAAQKIELPAMADETALNKLALRMNLKSAGGTTRIEDLLIELDQTRISGSASLKGEAIGFALDVDAIDADRYLPPAAQEEAQAPAAEAGSGEEGPLLPVETLRALDINGSLKIGRLTIKKLLAEQVELSVAARGGKLSIGQKVGSFYQGVFDGKVDIDVTGKTPVMQIRESMSGLQAGPLVKDLTGEDRFAGKGRFSADLNTRGNSVKAIKQSLGGKLDFRFEDGAVKGFNLARIIRETKAKFQRQSLPPDDAPPQTDFSELSASAVIDQGVLNNQDLLAKSPFLRVTGKGTVDLAADRLDYTVTPVVVSSAAGQGGEGLEELKGVPVPVRLSGSFAKPDYTIDWGAVLTGTQKAKIEEKKQEVQQKLEKKLQDGLQNKLKGLL